MSSSTQAPPKKTKGRQKMEMVKMANKNHLQVAFSKRRAGLFKKASDICTLCGAEAAVVVFSPANKVFCFGHPNVDVVANRFLNELPPNPAADLNEIVFEVQRNSTIRGLNLELTQLEAKLRMERRRGEKLDQVRKLGQLQQWYPKSYDEMNATQLYALKKGILELKRDFGNAVQKRMFGASNPHDFHPRGVGGEKENSINLCGFSFGSGSNVGGHDDFNLMVDGGQNESCINENTFSFGDGSNSCGNGVGGEKENSINLGGFSFGSGSNVGGHDDFNLLVNGAENENRVDPNGFLFGSGSNVGGHDDFHLLVNGSENENHVNPNGFLLGDGSNGWGNNILTFPTEQPIGSNEPNAHGNIVPTFPTEMPMGSNEANVCGNNVHTFISQMPIGSNEPYAHGNIVPTFQFGSNENVDTSISQMPIGSNEPNAHENIVPTFPTEMPIGSNPSCLSPTNPFAITDPNPNYTLSSIIEGFRAVTTDSNNSGGNNDIDPTTSPGENSGYLVIPATTVMIPGYFD